jgi:hypothetical protein
LGALLAPPPQAVSASAVTAAIEAKAGKRAGRYFFLASIQANIKAPLSSDSCEMGSTHCNQGLEQANHAVQAAAKFRRPLKGTVIYITMACK